MPKYVPITDTLCLVEQDVKAKANKTVFKRTSVNHLWIIDRSGSMTSMLPEMSKQLIVLSKSLIKGDFLSLGWFSSEGQYDWIFKGFKITDDSDYKALEKAIKDHSSSLGCTCFSEILTDTVTVIKDLSVISKTFSLSFFTDGYPVVSSYQKEISNIYSAINKIKGKISSSVFISYGLYYNKDLMHEMASKMGSMLISSNDINEYTSIITKLVQMSDFSEPKEEIEPLVNNPLAIFTISDQGVVIYSLDEDNKLQISPQKGQSSYVYYLSADKPNKKSWDKVEVSSINFGDPSDRLSKAIYSSALVLTQQTKTDIALEVIGKAGDKKIVDSLTNAFTVEEYGRAEDLMNLSITDVDQRFQNGRDPNYLPPVDAFCVFDLLKMLMADDEAAFYPYHEKFSYEKIGVASKVASGYSKFSADSNSKCPFSNLTWHESHLNLSVLTRINGTIDLHDVEGTKPAQMGFSNPYPTYVFRNYAFIKDGRVHTKKFYISSSKDTYMDLKNKGLVFDDTFKTDGKYGVNVETLSAVNRTLATGKTSATELCKMAMREQILKAEVKALKWLKDQEIGEDYEKPIQFTDGQAAFLRENGISVDKGGSYNPPREKDEVKDKYMAKAFDIKIAKLNTLPAVKKIVEKIAADKARTPVECLIEKGLDVYNAVKGSLKTTEAKVQWFDKAISVRQNELREIRSKVQEIKMAVILGRRWFDEFKSREEGTLTLAGQDYEFKLAEEAVEI